MYCSVLSPHVEQFFRKVVAENKKSRENIEMADEDYMQMLLNIGKKCGEFFYLFVCLSNLISYLILRHLITFN